MNIPDLNEVLVHYPEISSVHPACSLMPYISQEEFDGLAKDIESQGLIESIGLTDDGQLVDGRSRLMACYAVNCEVRFNKIDVDPWEYSISKNVHRRHLTLGQKAAIGYGMMGPFRTEANERQQAAGRARRKANTEMLVPNSAQALGKSRDKAAHLLGIQGQRISEFAFVENASYDLAEAVRTGGVSLHAAYKQAKEIVGELEEQAKIQAPPEQEETEVEIEQEEVKQQEDIQNEQENIDPSPAQEEAAPSKTYITLDEWKLLSESERAECLDTPCTKSKFNQQNNDSIEWALWSWNPITGCLHDCPYCYARDIANRFYEGYGFTPTVHPDRLKAPKNTPFPQKKIADALALKTDKGNVLAMGLKNVFTCSMADLFGRWVPKEWIDAVLTECAAAPQWNFLFLTKFPNRMSEFEFSDNCWVGTTVDCQARVKNAEKSFRKVKAAVKWLSCEPLLEPLKFNDLGIFDWIVLGGSSVSSQTPEWKPPRKWTEVLKADAENAGVMYYEKANLLERICQYPGLEQKTVNKAPLPLIYLPQEIG